MTSIEEIVEDLKALPPERLQAVASYARSLRHAPVRSPKEEIESLRGLISDEDADEMLKFIERKDSVDQSGR